MVEEGVDPGGRGDRVEPVQPRHQTQVLGPGEQVVDRRPRAVAYVACDPAALGRDVAIFAEHDYALTAIRAFDLFPMTHHVECVALLEPTRR